MTSTNIDTEYGAIVGRFQTHELHQAYIDIIETVCANHKRVIIFLGISPVVGSAKNPLSFEARKLMIQERYPSITILGIKDTKNDRDWVRNLEGTFRDFFPIGSVTFYGGRDSFIKTYTENNGKWPAVELKQQIYVSSTEYRKDAADSVLASKDFRAGIVHATANQYKKAVPTVDAAIVGDVGDGRMALGLVRKPGERKFRFAGGHVDPTDVSLEAAAMREGQEETSLDLARPRYVGSFLVDDWRYRSERDKIITTLFEVQCIGGEPEAKDDVAEFRWFPFDVLVADMVEPEHVPLMEAYIKFIKRITEC